MTLHVSRPGAFTLVVDGGRPHTRHLGVPPGGAADRAAWMIGNALVGNPPDAAALEIAFAGPTLRAAADVGLCLAGAPFQMRVDGRDRPTYTTFTCRKGETLTILGTACGARAYLCIAGGGLQTPIILGSRSGLSPVEPGTALPCPSLPLPTRALAADCCPHFPGPDEPEVLRVMGGPQASWFDEHAFRAATYRVLPASNRMGLRLLGPPLLRTPRELVSEAVAAGAVQVANDGQCIILGVDGQTIGGYPKIAHVIGADLDRLGQLRPGAFIRFEVVTEETAAALGAKRTTLLRTTVARIATADWLGRGRPTPG